MSKRSPAVGPGTLLRAVRTVLADRAWPLKLLVGGLLSTTLLGLPLSQGLLMEHIENSRKGFSVPLPRWHDLTSKYILGVLAVVIDFAFFIFPLLIGLVLMFCAAGLDLIISGVGRNGVLVVVGVAAAWVVIAFVLGLSPIGKLLFAEQGELERGLSSQPLRLAIHRPTRGIYARARLASLPAYGPVALAGAAWWWVYTTSTLFWLLAAASTLLFATLLLAHLLVAQVYLAAAEQARQIEFAARLAARAARES